MHLEHETTGENSGHSKAQAAIKSFEKKLAQTNKRRGHDRHGLSLQLFGRSGDQLII